MSVGFSRYRHKLTGQEYWGRRGEIAVSDPEIRLGWEHNDGVLEARISVWLTAESANGTYASHAVWVRTDLLEPLPDPEPIGEGVWPTPTVAHLIDEELENMKGEIAELLAADPGDHDEPRREPIVTDSGPDTPNIQLYLREMSFNVGTAFAMLAELVNNKAQDPLYPLQVAHASLSDEIRRLSERGAQPNG